jgi:hypothetical protein
MRRRPGPKSVPGKDPEQVLYFNDQFDRGVTRGHKFQFDNSTTAKFGVTDRKISTNTVDYLEMHDIKMHKCDNA